MSSNNIYRVGDYVYFESGSTSPFHVRRIEELNKSPTGNVEAKVMCFFRRRDLPSSLTFLADRHQSAVEEEGGEGVIGEKERHFLRHRELFLSRQVETLPATGIRGKCAVSLLNETESPLNYLQKEDTFFYSLVYDPHQKTLLADRGEIRVGQRYQADPPKTTLAPGEWDGRVQSELETILWRPDHPLTDKQIDQFLVVSRSVGTFARALDCSSSVKQPSLHMSAAAASRDVTLFHAMETLHRVGYDLGDAVSELVPSSGPLLCRDEIEDWSASEANLFEEALEKYGKDFGDIRSDYLPWKTAKNLVEYYYMWKTTDRYVQQKRVKAAENETRLKQVYIPHYGKGLGLPLGNKSLLNGNAEEPLSGRICESCSQTGSVEWFSWSGSGGSTEARLCTNCWTYWRKYGGIRNQSKTFEGDNEIRKIRGPSSEDGEIPITERSPGLLQQRIHRCAVAGCGKDFKMKSQLGRHYATSHGFPMRTQSPRPVMKTRTAFYLHTTPLTRVARRLCKASLRPRHSTRAPFSPINLQLIKQECGEAVVGRSAEELRRLVVGRGRRRNRGRVSEIAHTLGQPNRYTPPWLILTEKGKIPQPIREAYPKPPKAPDGSLIYERVPEKWANTGRISPSLKKRVFQEITPIEGPPIKRVGWDLGLPGLSLGFPGGSALPTTLTLKSRAVVGDIKGKTGPLSRVGSRKQIISWMDAPDDLYFAANGYSKRLRRTLTTGEMRRLARSPCKKAIGRGPEPPKPRPLVSTPPILPQPIMNPLLPDTKVVPVWRAISPQNNQ